MNYLSFIVAFAVTAVLNALLLPILRKAKAGQQILQYVTEHKAKQGTPTMGGIGFILAIALCAMFFCDVKVRGVAVAIAVFVAYGVVGFLDDFIKLKYKRNMGLHAYQKIIFQLAIALLVAWFVYDDVAIGSSLRLPFSAKSIKIGYWTIPFVVVVYLACTNGVNLTDGLDGLATSTTICYLAGMIALLKRELALLDKIGDTYAYMQTQQIVILCYVSCGALTAFLLLNCSNAKVFMGDTGSLALGALVAFVAIFTRMTLFVPLLGLMFAVSCLSVILQVAYFKISKGKRIFLMAPFHHHLQHKNWSETRICVLYSVVTVIVLMILLTFGNYYA